MENEMEPLPIVIVSRGRAERVSSTGFFPSAKIVCPVREAADYARHNPDHEVVPQPHDVVGLGATRQWIWDTYGDVFMADDDLTALVDLTAGPGEPTRVDPQLAEDLVQRTAITARQLGVKMFGFNPFDRPQGYTPQQPFRLTGFINFSNTGLFKDDDLFIPNELSLYDDFWLCLLNAHYHRWLFVDQRYSFSHKDTFHNPGGCATERNAESLRSGFARLKEAFGDAVVEKRPTKSKGVWSDGMAMLRLPF